ncbi:MAG: CsbD family protein [Anaerolineales bacterium]|nr:CsbD family protein [Anaerolineales bacterium]
MNKDEFEGKWTQMRGQVREWWGKLTDDDLDKVVGRYEIFIGVVQKRYGYTRERVESEVDRRMHEFEARSAKAALGTAPTNGQHAAIHAQAGIVGDFAAGERQTPLASNALGDFAEGQRDQPADQAATAKGSDFARGQRTSRKDQTVHPDFARGERHGDDEGPEST